MRIAYSVLVIILFTSTLLIKATANTYDPWCDFNDDGDIDIYDIVEITGRYNTSGTPVNKTALLYNVSETFDTFVSRLAELQSRVAELEAFSEGYVNAPAYDSGWVVVPPLLENYITLTHNLNTTEVFVYAIGKTSMGEIHQGNFGLNWYPYLGGGGQLGIRWYDLNATCLKVGRGRIDNLSPDVSWDYVRIMIWRIWTP